VGGDRAVVVLLVVGEGLVEVDDVVHAGEQHLPQGHARHQPFAVDRVAGLAQGDGGGAGELLGEDVEETRGTGAGRKVGGEQLWGQALLEGAVAGGVDADEVAVQALGAGPVALVDRPLDAGLLQAVRQGRPAGAAADDENAHRSSSLVSSRSRDFLDTDRACPWPQRPAAFGLV
jgi:hypothetical protein